jgi:hypothetical protein
MLAVVELVLVEPSLAGCQLESLSCKPLGPREPFLSQAPEVEATIHTGSILPGALCYIFVRWTHESLDSIDFLAKSIIRAVKPPGWNNIMEELMTRAIPNSG